MATHTKNTPPSTRVTLAEGASLTVDTINVNKELPKSLFSKYIPTKHKLIYDNVQSEANYYIYELPHTLDSQFLEHLNFIVDNLLITRVTSDLFSSSDSPVYYIDTTYTKLYINNDLYALLGNDTNTYIVYTSI